VDSWTVFFWPPRTHAKRIECRPRIDDGGGINGHADSRPHPDKTNDEPFTHQRALEDRDLIRYAKRIGLDLDRFSRELSLEYLRTINTI